MREDTLLVTTHREGSGALVELDGELDLHTAPVLVSAIRHLLDVGTKVVEVDAGAVAFADSSGLRALVVVHGETAQRGGDLRLVQLSEPLERVLDMTGLSAVLGVPRSARQR